MSYQDLVAKYPWIFITVTCILPLVFSIAHFVKVAHWPWVPGDLNESRVSKHYYDQSSDFSANVKYEYTVEGETFHGHRLGLLWYGGNASRPLIERQLKRIQQLPDGKVKVFYNPKKPKSSYLLSTLW